MNPKILVVYIFQVFPINVIAEMNVRAIEQIVIVINFV